MRGLGSVSSHSATALWVPTLHLLKKFSALRTGSPYACQMTRGPYKLCGSLRDGVQLSEREIIWIKSFFFYIYIYILKLPGAIVSCPYKCGQNSSNLINS